MSILKFLTSVSLAAFTATALQGERRCPGNADSVPLRVVQGALIVVSATVNGAGPFDFMVDTGAQITTVDEALASQLKLPISGTTGVSGVATYGRKAFTQLAHMEVAGGRVDDVLAVVDGLAQLQAADGKIRGILGEDFLAHFDVLIDNEHRMLCLDETGAMAAAVKGTQVSLARPYGPDHDLPFTRPLIIQVKLEGRREPLLFRLDSGSNVPLIYGQRGLIRTSIPPNARILKRVVEGVEQDFAVLQPQDLAVGTATVRQVIFVQPMNSVGSVGEAREDGLLPTQLFQRVLVSYRNQFAILNPR
jgi:predicted aspartyl protease